MKRHPKLKGQRLGQVVYNALADCYMNDEIIDKLFYISDKDLVKLINDYLKGE